MTDSPLAVSHEWQFPSVTVSFNLKTGATLDQGVSAALKASSACASRSLIGIILLIGIVKKNGILLVDFALEAERKPGLPAEEAIRRACQERFRRILMTTLASLLGAQPFILAEGPGSELHVPLGETIIGRLMVSQMRQNTRRP